jgi:CheY-like chemotaxis protein
MSLPPRCATGRRHSLSSCPSAQKAVTGCTARRTSTASSGSSIRSTTRACRQASRTDCSSRNSGKAGAVAGQAAAKGAILILVAEKDPITAELEEHFLNREGYDVHIVLDGRRAVDEAEKLQPDLIVLDIILPGLSGLKVCKALKGNPATASIPVLVFSVLDVRERALEAGADAFLLKPIEPAKLIRSVKDLLEEPVTVEAS